MENCVFCKIVKGELNSYKIYENEHVLAFLDATEDIDGHTLIIPKTHVQNIYDCSEEILAEVVKIIKKVGDHYKTLGYTGINVLNNNGKDAEQSVFHLHFHLIPRKECDNLKVFPKLKGAKLTLEESCKFFKL